VGKVDIDAIKATQEDIARGNGGGRGKVPTLEWKEGSYRLRILPPPGEMKEPWIKVMTCFKVGPGKKTLTPPRQYGLSPDPLSDLLDKLAKKSDKASAAQLKDIKPSSRFKMFVIDRDDEEAGPKLVDFNVVAMKTLVSYFTSPEWGDLTDPKEGHDIRVTYIPKEKTKKPFPEWEMVPSPKQTPLRPAKMSDEDYQIMLETNLFEHYGIGLPSNPAYIAAVLKGEEKDFKGNWYMNRDGSAIQRNGAPAVADDAEEMAPETEEPATEADTSFDTSEMTEETEPQDDPEPDNSAVEAATAKAATAAAKPASSAAAAVRAKLLGGKK
jgi:hypothetical protein